MTRKPAEVEPVCRKAELQAAGLFGCDCRCAECNAFYAPADASARAISAALDSAAAHGATDAGEDEKTQLEKDCELAGTVLWARPESKIAGAFAIGAKHGRKDLAFKILDAMRPAHPDEDVADAWVRVAEICVSALKVEP